jgi:hypothetical protein
MSDFTTETRSSQRVVTTNLTNLHELNYFVCFVNFVVKFFLRALSVSVVNIMPLAA